MASPTYADDVICISDDEDDNIEPPTPKLEAPTTTPEVEEMKLPDVEPLEDSEDFIWVIGLYKPAPTSSGESYVSVTISEEGVVTYVYALSYDKESN